MSHVVICSICSREKDPSQESLQARQRYRGLHVAKVDKIANEWGLPFFVLSGVYGLVPAEEIIPYYDHLLAVGEVSSLTAKLSDQLMRYQIDIVKFYTKNKPNWQLYQDALRQAADRRRVGLYIHVLLEND